METRANQSYQTEDIKVIKLSTMIKVANDTALAIAIIEFTRNTYRTDFNGAMVYIIQAKVANLIL